jgi:hypothetical protein
MEMLKRYLDMPQERGRVLLSTVTVFKPEDRMVSPRENVGSR